MHTVNNRAPRFIDLFWRFDGLGIEKYIALDEDRVRIGGDGLGYFEADTWFETARASVLSSLPPGLGRREQRLAVARRIYRDELPEAALIAHAAWSE
jgi:hypothetical protein